MNYYVMVHDGHDFCRTCIPVYDLQSNQSTCTHIKFDKDCKSFCGVELYFIIITSTQETPRLDTLSQYCALSHTHKKQNLILR